MSDSELFAANNQPTDDDVETDYLDGERDCHWCGGEGFSECDIPLECTKRHNQWDECPCASCGGTGCAKDMTIW